MNISEKFSFYENMKYLEVFLEDTKKKVIYLEEAYKIDDKEKQLCASINLEDAFIDLARLLEELGYCELKEEYTYE